MTCLCRAGDPVCRGGVPQRLSTFVCDVQLLENLVVAMESEAQVIDISRVSGFMQKVCVTKCRLRFSS